jgi:hypothetical protein
MEMKKGSNGDMFSSQFPNLKEMAPLLACLRFLLLILCTAVPSTGHTATVLLPDDRIVNGTVQSIRSGEIQVTTNELEPRFLSVEAAAEKGIRSLQVGDKVSLLVTAQNEVVDFHLANEPAWNRVVKGTLAQPLMGDQRWAVIRTEGRLEPYEIAEGNDARQKVINLPVGVPGLFLLNKSNTIIDATIADEPARSETLSKWSSRRQQISRQ